MNVGVSRLQRVGVGVVLALAVACGSSTSPSSFSVSPSAITVPAAGQTGLTAAVTATGNWEATPDNSAVTITGGSSGSSNGTVTFSVAANTSGTTQTYHVNITEATTVSVAVTITQGPPAATLNPNTQVADPGGDTGFTTAVTATGSWTASSDSPVVTITSGTAGTGNGTITYNVAANPSASAGTYHINVVDNGTTGALTITQAGAGAVLSLSTGAVSFNANAQSGQVIVSSNTSWTAGSDSAFLAITSGLSGINNGVIFYNVNANPTLSPNVGHITVTGSGLTQTLTVTQTGLTAALSISNGGACTMAGATSPLTLQCTLDASGSAPLSNIATFAFHLIAPSEDLEDSANSNRTSDRNPTWVNPLAPSCGFSVGTTTLQVRLTVLATTNDTATVTVPLVLNASSACFESFGLASPPRR